MIGYLLSGMNSLLTSLKQYGRQVQQVDQQVVHQTGIDLLENFRQAVWGNPAALTAQTAGQDGRPVLYIDLDHHLAAVQVIFMKVRRKEILVVQEYQEAIAELRRNTVTYGDGACISGQKQSGKSTFLAYALIERLREQQPVAVQPTWGNKRDAYILFTQNGTSVHNSYYDEIPIPNHGSNLWLLCDTEEDFQEPTLAFVRAMRADARIFLAASNRGRKWALWEGIVFYYMDLWSLQEIRDLGSIFKYEPDAISSMTSLAMQYGPMPRVVTAITENPGFEDCYREVVMEDVQKSLSDPRTALRALFHVDSPPAIAVTGASTVFFVRPFRDGDAIIRTTSEVIVPTAWLANQLVISLSDDKRVEKGNLVELLAVDKRTRSAAGCVYEAMVHMHLDHTTSVTVRWYDGPPQTISFPQPLETRTTDADLNSAPPFYWRPPKPNQAGIDGAIFTDDHVYLIQATISRNHPSPQNGISKFWNNVPEDKQRLPWKLIFIGPSDDQIDQASAKYSRSLQYGAAGTRCALQQDVTKMDLPVGRCSFHPIIPSVFDF